MYISTDLWRDLTDKHLYHAGDPFPFDGREIPEDRINSLLSEHNLAGYALIRLVEDEPEKKPTVKEEAPRRGKRSQKKATE